MEESMSASDLYDTISSRLKHCLKAPVIVTK